jgi:hypothetical protein
MPANPLQAPYGASRCPSGDFAVRCYPSKVPLRLRDGPLLPRGARASAFWPWSRLISPKPAPQRPGRVLGRFWPCRSASHGTAQRHARTVAACPRQDSCMLLVSCKLADCWPYANRYPQAGSDMRQDARRAKKSASRIRAEERGKICKNAETVMQKLRVCPKPNTIPRWDCRM